MRIAIVSYAFGHHYTGYSPGFERLAGTLAKYFAKNGHEIDVFTSYWPSTMARLHKLHPIKKRIEGIGDRIHVYEVKNTCSGAFSSDTISFNISIRKYRKLLNKADVIQSLQTCSFVPFTRIEKKKPVISSYFAHLGPITLDFRALMQGPPSWVLQLIQYRNSDIVMVSVPEESPEYRNFHRIFRISAEKIRFIRQGVAIDTFNQFVNCDENISQYGKPIILFVSSLHPRKGIKYLIVAMSYVVKEMPEAKLIIIGQGHQEAYLKNLAKKLNVNKNIIFEGFVPDTLLPKFYAMADVYVYPVILDTGWPLTPLEAMASGTPVIGTNVGAMKDLIKDAGILCEPKNSRQIADALIRLLSDKDTRNKMGKRGVEIIKEKFTWNVITKKYIEIYEEELERL